MDKEYVILDLDDRVRMQRLYEEVVPRLSEMALIVARNLNLDPALHGAVFERRFPEEGPMENLGVGPASHIRILSNQAGDSTGCYVYSRGAVVLCGRPPDAQ